MVIIQPAGDEVGELFERQRVHHLDAVGHVGVDARYVEAVAVDWIDCHLVAHFRHRPHDVVRANEAGPDHPKRNPVLDEQYSPARRIRQPIEHLAPVVPKRAVRDIAGVLSGEQLAPAADRGLGIAVAHRAAIFQMLHHDGWIVDNPIASRADAQAEIGVLVVGWRESLVEPLQFAQQRAAGHQEHAGAELHVADEIHFGASGGFQVAPVAERAEPSM